MAEFEVYRKLARKLYEESKGNEERGDVVEMDTGEVSTDVEGTQQQQQPKRRSLRLQQRLPGSRKRPADNAPIDNDITTSSRYHCNNVSGELLVHEALLLPWQAKLDWSTTNCDEDTNSSLTAAKRLRVIDT